MATVHFPSCADSAARLVRMGEAPETVFCVGGLGDENIRTLPKMSREELCNSTGFPLQQPFALVTYHPRLLSMPARLPPRVKPLCAAMEAVPGVYWLITGSNADAGGQICTARMQRFAAEHPRPRRVHPKPGIAAVPFGHAVRRAGGGQFLLRRGGNADL